jgi:predicted amidohydrolase
MSDVVNIAIICFKTTPKPEDNLATVENYIKSAKDRGAEWVFLPELWTHRAIEESVFQTVSKHVSETMQNSISALAKKYNVTMFAGTWTEKSEHPSKYYNTQYVIDPNGGCISKYRKVHLFAIQNENKEGYAETKRYVPGKIAEPFSYHDWNVGLSTCFDLRFSSFYEKLCANGMVDIITIPSGFLERTGKLHWEALLKARAIEHQCFVVAPNQVGPHENPVIGKFYGHSMVISPWGEIILDSGEETGVFLATLDKKKITEVRNTIPMREIKTCKKEIY